MMYKGGKFKYRSAEEVKRDIDAIKGIVDVIDAGAADPKMIKDTCFRVVWAWLVRGEKTVFLQDSDPLFMKAPELIEVIRYLKQVFPWIERVTAYARTKTVKRKDLEDLKHLKKVGLSRLHIGLESGDDEVLEYLHKGVTAEDNIIAGKKAIEAGIELSEYVMPGVGGKEKSVQHAENTAGVLNEINPHFIRIRNFIPIPGTLIFNDCHKGIFKPLSICERLEELKLMMKKLEITGRVVFDSDFSFKIKGNGWLLSPDFDGYKFPEQKQDVLDLLDKGTDRSQQIFLAPCCI